MDYLLGGLRYRLFFDGKFLTRVSLWDCMRSNWANIFLGAVTPMQTGGGPAQLYILWRAGAKVSEGMLVSLINFFATLIFFLIACTFSLLSLPQQFLGETLVSLMKIAYVVLLVYILFVLIVIFFPQTARSILRGIFTIIPIKGKKFQKIRDRLNHTIESGTIRFKKALKEILKYKKSSLVIVTVLTIGLFLNKFIIGYFIARMFWDDVPFVIFIALQIIQLFLIYFAPTPGASGVAELSSTFLIAYVLPTGLILIYTLIWRFLTTILAAIIGGFVFFADMRRLGREGFKSSD